MVYILLGNGFEEVEALAPCDILRRGGVEVSLTAVADGPVTGGHGIRVYPDCRVYDIDFDRLEMIVVPGGLGGVEAMEKSPAALAAVEKAHGLGREVAAICAGPRVLAGLGLLEGREAVCYPGMEDQMAGGRMLPGVPVARDGKLTTGRGPGAALDFGFALLEVLRGPETADRVRKTMGYDR